MTKALPPLAWFRAFESSARHLKFTAAAQELGMTQSAISQQVKALEARFGCVLFVRKHRGLDLTDEGRRLVPNVTQAIATLRLATDSFETNTDKQLLTIATSVSFAQWYLVPRIHEFSEANNNMAIRLMTKVWPDEFADTDVDIEIRFDSIKSAGPQSKPIGTSQSVLIASPNILADVSHPSPIKKTLESHPLIQVVGTADTWQSWADSTQYSGEITPSMYVDSHGTAVDLVRAGAGIALTSRTIAAPCIRDGSVQELDAMPVSAKDGYHLTVFPSRHSDLSYKFAAWLNAEVTKTEAQIAC